MMYKIERGVDASRLSCSFDRLLLHDHPPTHLQHTLQELNVGADGEGRRSGLTWMAVPCDVGGNPVEYLFQVGGWGNG